MPFEKIEPQGKRIPFQNAATTNNQEVEIDRLEVAIAKIEDILERLPAVGAPQQVAGEIEVTNFPDGSTVEVSNFPVTQTVVGSVAVSNFPDGSTVEVSNFPVTQTVVGSVAVSNFPDGSTVEVSNFPVTQPVSGTVAVSNLLATQPVSGTVAVSNLLATQPVTAASLPLPAGAAQESTLVQVRDRRLSAAQDDTSALSRTTKRRWREDFAGTSLSSAWQVVQQGTGQTIAVASSELTLTSGTTVNSETIIRSTNTFKIPLRVLAVVRISQRIINQEFYLEVIDSTGQHYARWLFDGTNSLVIKFDTANSGNSLAATATGSTTLDFVIHSIVEIDINSEEVNFYGRVANGAGGRSPGVSRTRQIPDPNLDYFIQIRAKNLATAPTSSTSFVFDSIVTQETEEFFAEVTGGRGGGNPSKAIPVTGSINVAGISGQTFVQAEQLATTTETLLPLLANNSYLGPTRNSANSRNITELSAFTDAPGTLIFEQQLASTFRQTHSFSIVSSTQVQIFTCRLVVGNYRVRYINSGTAQTVFELISTLKLIGA